jgi:hypothetical protein
MLQYFHIPVNKLLTVLPILHIKNIAKLEKEKLGDCSFFKNFHPKVAVYLGKCIALHYFRSATEILPYARGNWQCLETFLVVIPGE